MLKNKQLNMFSSPMMNGIRNNKTTSNKIDQHNKSSEYQANISISNLEIGYFGMLFIC
jgi:hypothetical protein